ncbi:hypothetical protein EGW08_002615, partial [Elysia chlorotica]
KLTQKAKRDWISRPEKKPLWLKTSYRPSCSTNMAASIQPSIFGVALTRILDSWTALQLAVQQGFGGPESAEKAQWMVHAIETWFNENEGLETYEVEEFLENVLNTEFDLLLEDNSTQEIARLICTYYRLCQEKKLDELEQRLQLLPRPAVNSCRSGGEQLEFDSSDETAQGPAFSNHSSDPPSTAQTSQAPSTSSAGNVDSMETEEQAQEDSDGWQVMRRGKKR